MTWYIITPRGRFVVGRYPNKRAPEMVIIHRLARYAAVCAQGTVWLTDNRSERHEYRHVPGTITAIHFSTSLHWSRPRKNSLDRYRTRG